MRKENPISPGSPNGVSAYFLAARPKTLIASISPVLIGTFLACKEGVISLPLFILTLLFALCMQIGANFANDYFDFIKKADAQNRIGPKRAVQQGWIAPSSMLKAAFIVLAFGLMIAIPLMLRAGLWSLPLTALCMTCAIYYTAGSKALGYLGLGEITAFFFFGPLAVLGSYFLQTRTLSFPVLIAGLAPGFLCAAILLSNNLRDEQTDKIAHKRTLVVRLGSLFSKKIYLLLLFGTELIPLFLSLFYSYFILIASVPLFLAPFWIKPALLSEDPHIKATLLEKTAILLMIYTILFCLCI